MIMICFGMQFIWMLSVQSTPSRYTTHSGSQVSEDQQRFREALEERDVQIV